MLTRSHHLLAQGFRWCSAWLVLALCLCLAALMHAHAVPLLVTAGAWTLSLTVEPADLLRLVCVVPALVTLLWGGLSWRWPRLTYLVSALMPAHLLACSALTIMLWR